LDLSDLPAYIDLVAWLRLRRYADTAGEARELIRKGAVRHESHALGKDEIWKDAGYLRGNPRVPASMGPNIYVKQP
jgi:hypothetical protein